MHFNSPLWRLELFSTPKGYSIKYTKRQFPPPSRSPRLGALGWRQRHRSRASPARWALCSPPKPPLSLDSSPSLGEGTLGENPAQTRCSTSLVLKAQRSLHSFTAPPAHREQGPQPNLHSTFSETRPQVAAPKTRPQVIRPSSQDEDRRPFPRSSPSRRAALLVSPLPTHGFQHIQTRPSSPLANRY